MMDESIRKQLLEINRIFYEQYAEEFSKTRSYHWRGWNQAWDIITRHYGQTKSVLDVGCGNGRFLNFLSGKLTNFNYLGIDQSYSFIQECQKHLANDTSFFMQFDISNDDFSKIAYQKYDLISLIAVLHHIPGKKYRKNLIKQLSGLLKEKGILLLTFWDFIDGSQTSTKIFPWSLTNFKKHDLEEGDYLLKWADSKDAQRYCHYFSEEEKIELIENTHLKLISRFSADNKNTYMILQK